MAVCVPGDSVSLNVGLLLKGHSPVCSLMRSGAGSLQASPLPFLSCLLPSLINPYFSVFSQNWLQHHLLSVIRYLLFQALLAGPAPFRPCCPQQGSGSHQIRPTILAWKALVSYRRTKTRVCRGFACIYTVCLCGGLLVSHWVYFRAWLVLCVNPVFGYPFHTLISPPFLHFKMFYLWATYTGDMQISHVELQYVLISLLVMPCYVKTLNWAELDDCLLLFLLPVWTTPLLHCWSHWFIYIWSHHNLI